MEHKETISCKQCIHYPVCCLWATTDLEQDEAHKYCFGNFKKAADLAPKSEIEKLHTVIFKKEDLMQEIAKERNKYSDEVECLRDLNRRLEKEMGKKEEKIQELIKQNNSIEVETASIVAREILALVWDAYQSTHYDAEFEEMLDKIEKKYTEDEE